MVVGKDVMPKYIGWMHGFSLGNNASWNGSSDTYVAWQWKANGGSRTTFTESGNNPGGGYQANTTAGFSIVSYSGSASNVTVGHGLGVAPKMIIFKNRTSSLAVWPTLKNSTINLAPKIKIRKLPNIKPGFFQDSLFQNRNMRIKKAMR
mgnify:CR=1 FL=1